MMFWILYPNWGATLYGEVRGAGDFRKVLRGMLGGLWVTIVLAVVFVLLAAKTFGWDFFNATNVNFVNYVYGYVTAAPAIPIWGYPPLLVVVPDRQPHHPDGHRHRVRRVVPRLGGDALAVVDPDDLRGGLRPRPAGSGRPRLETGGVPVVRAAADHGPGSSSCPGSTPTRPAFSALTLDASLVIAVTFFGTSFAATILPWWKPDLYNKSPIARYKVGRRSRSSASPGRSPTVFLGWVIYEWLSNSLYGIGVGNATLDHVPGRPCTASGPSCTSWPASYRRRQGINLDAIHAEIPAE